MKAGDIVNTKKGPALYIGGETKDIKNYKFPVTSGLGAATGQGLTFRFYDEIIGTARGILPGGVTPQQGRDLERAAFEEIQKDRPAAAIAAEIGGAAIPALLTGGGSIPITARGIGAAGLKSLGGGLIYGAGSGEGVTERISPAITTGLISGVGGAAAQLIARPLAKAFKEAKASFQKPEKMGKKAGQQLVKDALDYDKTDIDSAIKYITERSGKQYTLADIGPNSRAYLDAVNVLPGVSKKNAQDFLKKRNEGMIPRITSDLQEAFGAKAGYFDTYKALESARKTNGNVLYQKAMDKKIPINEDFVEILKRPSTQEAFKKAYSMAAEKNIKLPRINLQNGKMYTEQGNLVNAIDTKLLHWMKLSLDDGIYTGRSPLSGVGATQLGLQKDTKNKFLNYMDKYNKTYKRARDQWSGDTAIMDSLELGRKFDLPSQNVDEIAEEIIKMSKSELEAFRNGVLNNITEKMEKSISIGGRGTNIAFNMIKTPRSRNLIRKTFEPGKSGEIKFNKFISNLTDEIDIKDTSNLIVGNSATAGRQEAVSTIKKLVEPSDIQNLSPVGMIYGALKADVPNLQERAAKSAADEITRILLETNPKALERIAREITNKGTFKNILQTYIPKSFQNILQTPISSQVIASGANIPGEAIAPNISIENLIEKLNKSE